MLGGVPGTGKTTFAKALAASCNVPLIATSYSVWQRGDDGHLGNVLTAIHEDFKRAIESAPSILFIDEIDMMPSREHQNHRHRDWWDAIVGALLQELDGIVSREGVVVIAAINYVSASIRRWFGPAGWTARSPSSCRRSANCRHLALSPQGPAAGRRPAAAGHPASA